MDGRGALLGLGLVALSEVWASAVLLTSPRPVLFSLAITTVALGVLLATAGARQRMRGAPSPLFAGGLGLAAAAYIVVVAIGTQPGNWYEIGHVLAAAGYALAASSAMRESGRLRLGLAILGSAALVYLVLLVSAGSWDLVPAALLLLIGAAAAATEASALSLAGASAAA